MANSTRTRRYGQILKTKVATDFSLGTVLANGWSAEGTGFAINLVTRTADTVQNNFPVTGVDTITEHYTVTPGVDIKQLYFNALSNSLFQRATLRFTDTHVEIHLNQEE